MPVAAVAIVYAIFADRLLTIVAAATGCSPGTATILVKAAGVGLAAVPCVAIWRGAHRLARRIATSISEASAPPDEAADADLTGSNLLAGIFEIAIIFGAVTLLLAIIGPFMSLLDGLAVMLIAMTGLAIVIWRSARHLYALVRAASGAFVERMDSSREIPPASSSAGNAAASSSGIGPLTRVLSRRTAVRLGKL